MDDINIREHLEIKYPGSFESWDGFEMLIKMRERVGMTGELLVILYSKAVPSEKFAVTLHQAFHVTSDKNGQDIFRVGGAELIAEFEEAYIPKN